MNDSVNQGLDAIENLQLGKNSTELEYKEYPEAKQRLEEGIVNFKNISNDQQITNSLKSIEKTINQKNQVAANQQGILETQDEVTSLINTQQERIQSSKEILAQQDRNRFIDQIDQDQDKPIFKEEQLAFNINLFNLDQQTKNRILSLENPYLLLLDNKKAFIDGFMQEFNANTAQELQVSEAFYSQTKNNLQQLQTQIAGLYKTLQPQYQTFLTNNQMGTSKKTLTAGGGSISPNQAITSIDPASYIKGIYIPTENRELTKALYSDKNAEIINKRYQLIDINKDKTEDILLWDDHSVYIKYGKQDLLFYTNGKPRDKRYYNKFYVAKLSIIPSSKTYLTFDKDTNLKIADQHFEVKNFLTQGQTFDNISFGWKKSNESSVYAYLIKLTDRVDYSPEKQDLTDTDNIIKKNKYLLVLPQSSSFSDLKIELPTAKNSTTTNSIEKFLDRDE
ncbi:MAG: hypothetical protein LBI53_08250 [Candidatus Peribacteria bacterium]|nr:hypothetical protein [Candidatus Peribacteria bacterium]